MLNEMQSCLKGLFILSALLLLTSCTNHSSFPVPGTIYPSALPLQGSPSNPAKPLSTQDAIPSHSPTPSVDHRPQYLIEAVLDYNQHLLSVRETITYTNNAPETLNELVLMVEPNRYRGVFRLNSIAWGDGQAAVGYTLDGNQMRLPLAKPLSVGTQTALSLSYELYLPSPQPSPLSRPAPFGYTARQANLVDWYPFVAPFVSGQGWLAHPPGYFGEHLVYEMADTQVNIQLTGFSPTSTTTAASKIGGPALSIAASTQPQVDGDWFRYRFENARNFAWSVSNEYQVKTSLVGDTTVYSYAFPFHVDAGDAALEATAQALNLFNGLFGSYPHSSLTVVEADFLDGMEYDGLYFLSNGFYNLYNGSPAGYLTAIAAHETAHQWWYGLVGSDQAMQPWLDEALCTYSERIFYERVYPEALDWWWTYRVNYYQPKGWIDGSIYSYASVPDAYQAYRDAVYLNGAMFLEELRKLVGDEAFFAFLKDYAGQNAGKIASRSSFLSILKSHTPADLTPLLAKYFSEH